MTFYAQQCCFLIRTGTWQISKVPTYAPIAPVLTMTLHAKQTRKMLLKKLIQTSPMSWPLPQKN